MSYNLLITAVELARHLDEPDWAVIDSRFVLADPSQGRRDYESGHIPGAVYAHLDEDLSGPIIKGVTGRHPLPEVEQITAVFSRLGIDSGVQVVAYDAVSGALAAGRVWWLLRWLGHEQVALLDGGWQAWVRQGMAVRSGNETRQARHFIPHPRPELIISTEEVDKMRTDPEYLVLDARTAERYRGENETIDPVAGHIPGAVNAPYPENLNPDGTFRSDEDLAARYKKLIEGVPVDHIAVYCGSGVTATHDIIAMMKAGLGEAKLYAGSYSEWITNPKRPVEK